MALAAGGGLVLAVFVARREADKLVAPISELADRAERLGSGDFNPGPVATGTRELDTLGDALALSSRRLAELLAREREFSANASHQLRTPLTALRVSLDRGDLAAAAAEADRLAVTVDHMLAVARSALPAAEVVEIGPIVTDATERWRSAYTRAGRKLVATISADLAGARVRPTSITQVIDVLFDNSLRHGAGTTRIQARPSPGGVIVQVDDDGLGIDPAQAESVFERHNGVDNGIGLALARMLLEADGGRLLLSDPDRAEFRIVLAAAQRQDQPDAGPPRCRP